VDPDETDLTSGDVRSAEMSAAEGVDSAPWPWLRSGSATGSPDLPDFTSYRVVAFNWARDAGIEPTDEFLVDDAPEVVLGGGLG